MRFDQYKGLNKWAKRTVRATKVVHEIGKQIEANGKEVKFDRKVKVPVVQKRRYSKIRGTYVLFAGDLHRYTLPNGQVLEEYVQETMQGLAFQAELLQRAGFPAWPRLRLVADFATRWAVWNASAVGTHLPWWYNKRLGISAPTQGAGYGRLFGYTDWLYGS